MKWQAGLIFTCGRTKVNSAKTPKFRQTALPVAPAYYRQKTLASTARKLNSSTQAVVNLKISIMANCPGQSSE